MKASLDKQRQERVLELEATKFVGELGLAPGLVADFSAPGDVGEGATNAYVEVNEQLLELFPWEEPSEVGDVLYDRASEEVELGLSVRETVDEP